MSAELFVGAGLLLSGSAVLGGLVLSAFWAEKDKQRAHRLLSALYYMGWPPLLIGFALLLARAWSAA